MLEWALIEVSFDTAFHCLHCFLCNEETLWQERDLPVSFIEEYNRRFSVYKEFTSTSKLF